MKMKPDWLKEIEEREAKATNGPWHTGGYFLNRETNKLDLTSVWGPINHAAGHQSGKQIVRGGAVEKNDGEFIAHARTDITALLQALNKAYEALERIAVDPDCGCSPCHLACRQEDVIRDENSEMREIARAALSFNPATREKGLKL